MEAATACVVVCWVMVSTRGVDAVGAVGDDSGAVPAPGPLPTAGTEPTTPLWTLELAAFTWRLVVLVMEVSGVRLVFVSSVVDVTEVIE